MRDKHYIIYADESDKKGRYYSNFFGGVLLAAEEREQINHELEAKKAELGLLHEVKWQNVDQTCVERYIEFIQYYFQYIAIVTIACKNNVYPKHESADKSQPETSNRSIFPFVLPIYQTRLRLKIFRS